MVYPYRLTVAAGGCRYTCTQALYQTRTLSCDLRRTAPTASILFRMPSQQTSSDAPFRELQKLKFKTLGPVISSESCPGPIASGVSPDLDSSDWLQNTGIVVDLHWKVVESAMSGLRSARLHTINTAHAQATSNPTRLDWGPPFDRPRLCCTQASSSCYYYCSFMAARDVTSAVVPQVPSPTTRLPAV